MREQLRNAVSVGGVVAELAVAVAVDLAAAVGDSDMKVDLWIDNISTTSFAVMELMTPKSFVFDSS